MGSCSPCIKLRFSYSFLLEDEEYSAAPPVNRHPTLYGDNADVTELGFQLRDLCHYYGCFYQPLQVPVGWEMLVCSLHLLQPERFLLHRYLPPLHFRTILYYLL